MTVSPSVSATNGTATCASDRCIEKSVLIGIVAVKVAALAFVGPLFQIDSGGYLQFADLINSGFGWMTAGDPHQTGIASFRMVGYPAILAGAKLIFGDHFAWAIATLQSALGIVATALFFRAAVMVMGSVRIAAILAAAYLFSPALQYDLFILTDSLYSSLLTILISAIVAAWAGRRPASPGIALGLGALLAVSFLIRETSLLFGLLFLPLVLVWASNRGWRAAVVAGLLFLLPVIGTWEGYREWNGFRTGEKFVTTANGLALLYALASMDSLDRQALSGITPVDRAIQDSRTAAFESSPSAFSSAVFMTEAMAATAILGNRDGMSAIGIERAVEARFFEIIGSRPLLIVRKIGREMMSDNLWGEINPVRAVRELVWWRETGEFEGIRAFVTRLAAERQASDIAFLPLEILSRAASVVCWLAFFSTPLVAGLGVFRRRDQGVLLSLALFIPAAGVIGAYAMVCLTQRYLIGVVPAILLCATQTLRTLFSRRTVGDPGEPLTHYSHATLS